jgi:hypothetical protein
MSVNSTARSGVPTFDGYDYGLLLGCVAFLYASLFASPATPFLLGGDQVYFWMNAQRLLHGEQIYRDFFEFTPPGTDLLYLGVFKLFAPRIWTPNVVVLALGTTLCTLCLYISKSIMPRAQAALATSLYVVFVIGMTPDGTHHWFSLLATMGAVAILTGASTPTRTAMAGALLGLATFITQTRGPVAAVGIAVWMTWERRQSQQPWSSVLRRQMCLFLPLILTWAALSGYYIVTVGLRQLWYFQVTYAREYKVTGWNAASIGFPQELSRASLLALVRWLFAYAVLPAVYAISLWRCVRISREAGCANAARVCLLTIVGTALFVEIAQSPNWFRFYCVCLPGVILLVWLVGALNKISVFATRTLWIGVVGLAAYQTWSMHTHNCAVIELPAGRVAMLPVAAEKLAWLAARTQPGQFMLQAGWPGVYLPLGVRNPLYVESIGFEGATELGYLALSIRQLEAKRVQYIVWSPRLESPPYSLATFHDYLVSHYRFVYRFADHDEVWARNTENAARVGAVGSLQ